MQLTIRFARAQLMVHEIGAPRGLKGRGRALPRGVAARPAPPAGFALGTACDKTRRVSAHAGYGPMARTTQTMT